VFAKLIIKSIGSNLLYAKGIHEPTHEVSVLAVPLGDSDGMIEANIVHENHFDHCGVTIFVVVVGT